MKRLQSIFLTLAVILLTGCGESENEFTTGACYVVIDNAIHQDATLAGAMNPQAPGIFCIVKRNTRAGVTYFDFVNNAGVSSSKPLNAIDTRRTLIVGHNNGIIVGYGTLNIPPTFYAYDLECPNCFDPNAIPIKSKPLSLNTNGIAICSVCHRQYDLNNNGFISSGEAGNKLTRYRANTTGPFGVLAVN